MLVRLVSNSQPQVIRPPRPPKVLGLQATFFFFETVLLCRSGWSAVVWSRVTATSASWIQAIILRQPPKVCDYRHEPLSSAFKSLLISNRLSFFCWVNGHLYFFFCDVFPIFSFCINGITSGQYVHKHFVAKMPWLLHYTDKYKTEKVGPFFYTHTFLLCEENMKGGLKIQTGSAVSN